MAQIRKCARIVVSGGPKSGKTTLIRDVLVREFGIQIQFLPEVPTLLYQHVGVRVPVPGTPEHALYSRHITLMQIALEEAAAIQAGADGKRVILCDRGIVDNIAYLPRRHDQFEELTGVRRADAYARYDLSVVLELAPREVFEDPTRGGNASRKENYDEAVMINSWIHDVWRTHPGYRFVGNDGGWEAKASAAAAIVRGFLGQIERGAQ